MESQELESKIKQLGAWYQKINIDGIITTKGGPYSGIESAATTWKKMLNLLGSNFEGLNILDLGCNAGFYSIMAANKGAKVVGIELTKVFFRQAIFLKDFYEQLWNKKLDITYINKDILDVDFDKFGKFDCIFALSILYHIGKHKYGKGTPRTIKEQKNMVSLLSKITSKFVVRARTGKNKTPEYYNSIFRSLGFTPSQIIPEGKRTLILYER